MRANAVSVLIVLLLMLVGVAGAVIQVDVVGNQSWLVAGTGTSAQFNVTVTNTTSGIVPIAGATVSFSVNPAYGTMSPSAVTTDLNGRASSTFTVNTTSGTALILASISYTGSNGPFTMTQQIPQKIDHNLAYYATFIHPLTGSVASQVPFNVSITDQYRNPVDNRRGNHIISLHVHGPYPDDCGFAEAGFAHDISSTLDANGNASVNVKLTKSVGDNNVLMDGYQSIPLQLEWITAEARGAPVLITQDISPSGSPPSLPADGKSLFTIVYTLYDVYGNPTNGQYIWINTTVPGEEKQFITNSLGQITYPYGPRDSIGSIYITAKSVAAPNVSSIPQNVVFTNTGAAIISLTATPDTMASHDVPPSTSVSNIIATVVDASGNAVPGETVTFNITNEAYEATYNVTAPPRLSSLSAITDAFGQATIQFIPGNFTTLGNAGFNSSATGHCTVGATWNGTSKTVPVTWKNYPYLSVRTSVSPPTVGINETVNVTLELNGDGFLMQTSPVDVVMVMDKSGSMSNYNVAPGVTRIKAAKDSANTFVNKMTEGSDRIALVSYDQEATVTIDDPLGSSFSDVKTKINAITPNNGPTAMREGFKQSIGHLITSGRPSAIRAVVLMTDGNWNQGGSPLAVGKGYDLNTWVRDNRDSGVSGPYYGFSPYATDFEDQDYRWYSGLGGDLSSSSKLVVKTPRQVDPNTGVDTSPRTTETRATSGSYCANGQNTWQNMSIYAKDNNIRLYTLSFASTVPPDEVKALTILANSTGGFYRNAPTQADLTAVYAEIAADLKDPPGVNVSSSVDFQYINVTGVTIPGAEVYTYVPLTKIGWQDGTTNVTDQTTDWGDQKLNFTVGTIKVGQQWNATFRLRVNQSGLIDVFGNQSTVSFNNGGPQKLVLPQTFITVVPSLDVLNVTAKTITLKNLNVTASGAITSLLPVTWKTTYTGNQTLTERIYYRIDTGPWIQFDTKIHPYNNLTMDFTEFAQLDVTKLPPGGYWIKVYATASDAPDATIMLDNPVEVGNRGRTYIKIE